MDLENGLDAGVQIAHNFGAAAIVGLPIAALWLASGQVARLRLMAWLTLIAWLTQSASGLAFGAVSFWVGGELPDIHHLALAALYLKIFCAVAALLLLAVHFFKSAHPAPGIALWRMLGALGLTALTAAAVLRWFS